MRKADTMPTAMTENGRLLEMLAVPRRVPPGELMSDFMPRKSSKVEMVHSSRRSPSGVMRRRRM